MLEQKWIKDFGRKEVFIMNKQEILVKKLIEKKYTISFAESCTGGKMAATIVDVADASKVLNASFVTYANAAKMKYVNVSKETLDTLGAVSEQTAKEMAEGVAKANQANVGVGITGIAGPTGGSTLWQSRKKRGQGEKRGACFRYANKHVVKICVNMYNTKI